MRPRNILDYPEKEKPAKLRPLRKLPNWFTRRSLPIWAFLLIALNVSLAAKEECLGSVGDTIVLMTVYQLFFVIPWYSYFPVVLLDVFIPLEKPAKFKLYAASALCIVVNLLMFLLILLDALSVFPLL